MYTVKNKRVFPSPPEVDWFIPYANNVGWVYDSVGVPSPREGNRLIYSSDDEHLEYVAECYRPLSRYIGLYRKTENTEITYPNGFRPLSRYIGLYQNIKKLFGWIWSKVSVPARGR